jgi:hypothetical protein
MPRNLRRSASTTTSGKRSSLRSAFQNAPNVSFLFSGSMHHLMREIFAPTEAAFSQFGGFYELSEITDNDWKAGIVRTLAEDRCTIDADALDELVASGHGHPRSTMLLAQHAHRVAVRMGVNHLTLGHVQVAMHEAMAAERLRHEQVVGHVKSLATPAVNRYTLRTLKAVARKEGPYAGKRDQAREVGRAVDALRADGLIEKDERNQWYAVDPLLARFLGDLR